MIDFVDRLETAKDRDKFKERLTRILLRHDVELRFVRWRDPAWLLVVLYRGKDYTLTARIENRKRFAVSTIKHLKDRVVFWKKLMDENEQHRSR